MISFLLNAIIVIYKDIDTETPVSFRGVVRFQSNVDKHDPEVCYKDVTQWEKEKPCEEPPKFVPFGMNVSTVISLTVGNLYKVYPSRMV